MDAWTRLWRRLADAWVTAKTRRRIRARLCPVDNCGVIAVHTAWPVPEEHGSGTVWCCSAAHEAEFWASYTGGM